MIIELNSHVRAIQVDDRAATIRRLPDASAPNQKPGYRYLRMGIVHRLPFRTDRYIC